MPTFYTEVIEEGGSFEEFVWGCARAFGALGRMREDPADAPIPKRVEPNPWHKTQLGNIRKELDAFVELSEEELAGQYAKYVENLEASIQQYDAKREELLKKYTQVQAQVAAWVPPTSDHRGLKDFMIQQISVSVPNDYIEAEIPSYEEWIEERVRRLEQSLQYYQKQWEKEVKMTKEANKWLDALRESVPLPSDKGEK